MIAQKNLAIIDVAKGKRARFDWILEESFEGWYLMHSRRTLRDIELVRAAMSSRVSPLIAELIVKKCRETISK